MALLQSSKGLHFNLRPYHKLHVISFPTIQQAGPHFSTLAVTKVGSLSLTCDSVNKFEHYSHVWKTMPPEPEELYKVMCEIPVGNEKCIHLFFILDGASCLCVYFLCMLSNYNDKVE